MTQKIKDVSEFIFIDAKGNACCYKCHKPFQYGDEMFAIWPDGFLSPLRSVCDKCKIPGWIVHAIYTGVPK